MLINRRAVKGLVISRGMKTPAKDVLVEIDRKLENSILVAISVAQEDKSEKLKLEHLTGGR